MITVPQKQMNKIKMDESGGVIEDEEVGDEKKGGGGEGGRAPTDWHWVEKDLKGNWN